VKRPRDTPLAVVALLVCLGVGLGYLGVHGLRRPHHELIAGDESLRRAADTPGLHVYFIGNSFTFFNDMPGLLEGLSASEEKPVVARLHTIGGSFLRQHAEDPKVAAAIAGGRWDCVVLQEQSRLPSLPDAEDEREFYPFVRMLTNSARAAGSHVLLYQTWGYRFGDPDHGRPDDFASMEQRLEHGYGAIGQELAIPIAPVGRAWAEVRRRRPDAPLWDTDGKHPTLVGSYLAACVFYRVLYGKSPAGNPFLGGLAKEDAAFLQDVAGTLAM
jgi:hypothetical protein